MKRIFAIIAAAVLITVTASDVFAARSLSVSRTVVIDAGHGGFDGGTVSLYGVCEKEINLSVARYTEAMLKALGFETVMTRQDDVSLGKTKKDDMHKRLEIIKATPDSVFISIHQNHFVNPIYGGAQMFYGDRSRDESLALAQILQQNFISDLDPQNTRQIKSNEKGLYLFKNAPQPCVLIECGFLSNPAEAKKLEDGKYQQEIAFVIAKSIYEYYSRPEK